MLWTLGVDTSDASAYAALYGQAADVLYEADCPEANSHNEVLALLVQDVCAQAGLSLCDVSQLVCGAGPGSFTGLRIGLGFMKGLALGLRIPLQLISSLKAAAFEFRRRDGSGMVCALYDARRSEYFCAVYRCDSSSIKELHAPAIIAAADLDALLKGLCLSQGSSFADVCFVGGAGVELPNGAGGRIGRAGHVAGSLCRLAAMEKAADAGIGSGLDGFDLAGLSGANPHYLRPVAARTIAERLTPAPQQKG